MREFGHTDKNVEFNDKFNLSRFVIAQSDGDPSTYNKALYEIQHDHFKCSCWMWYVFPIHTDVALSHKAKFYALSSFAEAREYLKFNDGLLGDRLLAISKSALSCIDSGIHPVMLMGGRVDAEKLRSSMTMFYLATDKATHATMHNVAKDLIDIGFCGNLCQKTLEAYRAETISSVAIDR